MGRVGRLLFSPVPKVMATKVARGIFGKIKDTSGRAEGFEKQGS